LQTPLKEGIGGEREGDFMDNFIVVIICCEDFGYELKSEN
jgi:hypothetical protein